MRCSVLKGPPMDVCVWHSYFLSLRLSISVGGHHTVWLLTPLVTSPHFPHHSITAVSVALVDV